MANDTWAYCPDRQGTCGLLIADAERMERDAARIAELGAEVHQLRLMAEQAAAAENANAADLRSEREELRRTREEVQRLTALHDSWMEAARLLKDELRDVDTKRSRLLADCRDLERENASLRRRLAVGGR